MNNSSYSVMTLNVRNFMNSEMEDSFSEIQPLIQPYDIIALQEVYNTKILHMITKGYNYSYNKGNLLMTKFPILNLSKNLTNETFTSLIINFPLHQQVFVTNVHLNHIDGKRNTEIDYILDKINNYSDYYSSILLGDLNALTKADNSSKELTDKLLHEWYDCETSNRKHIDSKYNIQINSIYTKNMNVSYYNIIETTPLISNLVEIKFN